MVVGTRNKQSGPRPFLPGPTNYMMKGELSPPPRKVLSSISFQGNDFNHCLCISLCYRCIFLLAILVSSAGLNLTCILVSSSFGRRILKVLMVSLGVNQDINSIDLARAISPTILNLNHYKGQILEVFNLRAKQSVQTEVPVL